VLKKLDLWFDGARFDWARSMIMNVLTTVLKQRITKSVAEIVVQEMPESMSLYFLLIY
jgi:hypothetical protein